MTAAVVLPARSPLMGGIARLYRSVRPGERVTGMRVALVGGGRRSVLVVEGDGQIRRLTDEERPWPWGGLNPAARSQALVSDSSYSAW